MDSAKIVKELRECTGLSRKDFSLYTGIPVRTLEDWEASRRTPPDYILRLLDYKIRLEMVFSKKQVDKIINIISDVDGKKVVLINDIRFKSRRNINWDEIETILKEYVGEFYEISATSEKVFVGTDFPDEYAHSKDTRNCRGANEKAKANAINAIGELIKIADNKAEYPDYDGKHGSKAKNGWYRYDTRFGIPLYNENGELERYNIFSARMLVRRDEKDNLFLYDIVRIKKETCKPL